MEPCAHYTRGCDLLAPCCNRFFPCRFCHDAEMWDAEPDVKKKHKMDRHAVQVVRCRSCEAEQPHHKTCSNCQRVLGTYYCSVCVLFDDDLQKQIYHCAGCGICRVGPQESYFHCATCNACLAISQREGHKCLSDVLKSNCAVCQEDLFSSRQNPVPLSCGHYLHSRCQKDILRAGYFACPICGKAIVDMSEEYKNLDEVIETNPMPEDLRDIRLKVLCKDCQTKSETPYHFYGLKCSACGSYNTARI